MIELPDLDDRTFTELTAEARALIPTLAPGWTDHNPTDPGIVLVELFAWLTEMVMYRIDRVPERSYRTFLRLLRGPGDDPPAGVPIADAVRTTLTELRACHRAITRDDFERLALHHWSTLERARALGAAGVVLRARCFPEQSPDTLIEPDARAEGHYTLVIVPQARPAAPALLDGLRALLDDWRLLTTKVHVLDHASVAVNVSAKLYLRSDGVPDVVRELARSALAHFFDPLRGWRGAGWPFGRTVFSSEVRAVLDDLPGVDFVGSVELARPEPPLHTGEDSDMEVALQPHELPELGQTTFHLFYRVGTRWQPI